MINIIFIMNKPICEPQILHKSICMNDVFILIDADLILMRHQSKPLSNHILTTFFSSASPCVVSLSLSLSVS